MYHRRVSGSDFNLASLGNIDATISLNKLAEGFRDPILGPFLLPIEEAKKSDMLLNYDAVVFGPSV